MALRIPQTLLEQLRQHGEETYPHECCGIMVGVFTEDGIRVQSLMRCGNTRTDSAHNRYQISPADLFRAQREAGAQGQEIVGFYHSHPDHPARWSSTDLAEAHWTGCAYVITSVDKGKAAITNAFLLSPNPPAAGGLGAPLPGVEQDKHFDDEAIIITGEAFKPSPSSAQLA